MSSDRETCRQCGVTAPAGVQLPVVAIQALLVPEEAPDALMTDGKFAAWPMCANCHVRPRIKAAFFYRQDAALGLWGAANLDNIGM